MPRRGPASDDEVLALLDAGRLDAAATALIRGHGAGIHRYLRGVLRNETDAADAHALWAEHVWRSLPAFRRECSLDTWSHRVAWGASRHVTDDAFRRRGRAFRTGEASRLAAESRRSSSLDEEAQSAALDRLRDRLTDQERALLILRLDQGRSWDECADILSTEGEAVNAAALRKRFERMKQRLGELAREEGLVE